MEVIGAVTFVRQGVGKEGKPWQMVKIEGLGPLFLPEAMQNGYNVGSKVAATVSHQGREKNKDGQYEDKYQVLSIQELPS